MVDDQIDWLQWIDLLRIAAELRERVAHCCEIDNSGDAGEVLKKHAGRAKGDFLLDLASDFPFGERLDVGGFYKLSILVPEEILEEDLEAEGEPGGVAAGD